MTLEMDRTVLAQLLLRSPAPITPDRHMIYVCPECGDLGCGALTVAVQRYGGVVVWSDFAYENDYDPSMTDRETYQAIGPFAFERAQYAEALENVPRLRGA